MGYSGEVNFSGRASSTSEDSKVSGHGNFKSSDKDIAMRLADSVADGAGYAMDSAVNLHKYRLNLSRYER